MRGKDQFMLIRTRYSSLLQVFLNINYRKNLLTLNRRRSHSRFSSSCSNIMLELSILSTIISKEIAANQKKRDDCLTVFVFSFEPNKPHVLTLCDNASRSTYFLQHHSVLCIMFHRSLDVFFPFPMLLLVSSEVDGNQD